MKPLAESHCSTSAAVVDAGSSTGKVTTRRGSSPPSGAAARLQQLGVDRLRRIVAHPLRGLLVEQLGGAREQQLQVVVQLGHRPDRRARAAHRIGLVDRDRRRHALDLVDRRPVHPLEELARVGAEGLDVAALPFGVQRVEDQARLARAARPGHHRHLPGAEVEIEVLEVVLSRAADADDAGGHEVQGFARGAEHSREPGVGPCAPGANAPGGSLQGLRHAHRLRAPHAACFPKTRAYYRASAANRADALRSTSGPLHRVLPRGHPGGTPELCVHFARGARAAASSSRAPSPPPPRPRWTRPPRSARRAAATCAALGSPLRGTADPLLLLQRVVLPPRPAQGEGLSAARRVVHGRAASSMARRRGRRLVGSQNHNWGSQHTDHYACGQVPASTTHRASSCECSTASEVGPLWTPRLTPLVLRLEDRDDPPSTARPGRCAPRADSDFGTGVRAPAATDARIEGRFEAPSSPSSGWSTTTRPAHQDCLNSKLAGLRGSRSSCPGSRCGLTLEASRRLRDPDRRTDHGIAVVA